MSLDSYPKKIDSTVPINVAQSELSFDGFGRFRVAGTGQRLDMEFTYNKQEEFFDEITNNGSVAHNSNSRDITLALADAATGSFATMRSHPVPYTPGNSQLWGGTGVLDLSAIGGGVAQVFLRSKVTGTVVEDVVDQDAWSDGKAVTADWTKSHIFSIDFQSLKVGRIRFMMVRAGVPTLMHEMDNDNVLNTGYWQLPSLPAYWRIYNDATHTYMECGYGDEDNAVGFRYKILANASATMRAICCTVKSEGGQNLQDVQGIPRSADNGVTVVTVGAVLIPVISIKVAATFEGLKNMGIALPLDVGVQTDNPIRLVVIHNATLTGASWTAIPDSMMESDVSSTAISGGHEVDSGYFSSAAKNRASSGESILGKAVLWARQNGATGTLTLAAVRTTATSADVLAAIKWREIR